MDPTLDPEELIAWADAVMADVARAIEHRARRRAQHDALEAYRFAAQLIAARGRTADIPRVAELREKVRGWEAGERSVAQLYERALGDAIARTPSTSEHLRDLVRSHSANDRRLIAAHAALEPAAGAALVASLAGDPDPTIREIVAQRLPDAIPPWWTVAFSSDPLLRVDPAASAQVLPALRQIAEGWDDLVKDVRPFIAALDALPPVLVHDVVRRATIVGSLDDRTHVARLLGLILERPGGADVMFEALGALERRSWYGLIGREPGPRLLQRGAPEVRAARLLELAERVLELDDDDDDDDDVDLSLRFAVAADVVLNEWPAEVDASPLVERVLARPNSVERGHLLGCVPRTGVHAVRWAERLLEERASGNPGPVSAAFESCADALIAAMPPEMVRPYAERALVTGAAWAVAELLGRCHEPNNDPPIDALATMWVEEPRLRKAVIATRPKLVIHWLRARLARGDATLTEIGPLLGRGAPRLRVGEWAQIRALRGTALAAADTRGFEILRAFPRKTWTPEDWADFDRFIELEPLAAPLMVNEICRQTGVAAVARVDRLLTMVSRYRARVLLKHRTSLAARHTLELGPPVLRSEEADDDDF